MQDVAILTFPIETAHTAFSTSRRVNSRTFSQAVPKRDQWKIDAGTHANSRGHDGSDASPASFELRVFEQALRQKQHGWGAAWGTRKRFNQRFCIERVLTRHRRALRAIVCKMWLSLHSPSKLLLQLSAHPGESIPGLSAKLCQNVTNGRLLSGFMQTAEDKMAVMLGRHPLNSESLSRP